MGGGHGVVEVCVLLYSQAVVFFNCFQKSVCCFQHSFLHFFHPHREGKENTQKT